MKENKKDYTAYGGQAPKSSEMPEAPPGKDPARGTHSPIDPATTVIPFICILLLCAVFIIDPKGSSLALESVRTFLGDTLGSYYLIIGLGVFLCSLWLAFSDIGSIVLGGPDEKPRYSFLQWGAMVFCCGLAADILFYSFCEWIFYATDPGVAEMGSIQDWASTYPLFHWSLIPWSFYAVLAACFGFMLHSRGRTRQKYSESCRPILGAYTDGLPGKLIDVLAVFALIAGTATTFAVATPLISNILTTLFGFENSKWLTIGILLAVCATYTASVLKGMRGVAILSNICMYIFGALLLYVLVFGGQARYIVESGLSALGNMIQNFLVLSTRTDPLRTSYFPQNWTIFYWAYWMVWCVAAPFFMGDVSRGRSVKQVILGSYIFGASSTLVSFIVLGGYGMGLQMSGAADFIGVYSAGEDLYTAIMSIIQTLPMYPVVLVLVTASMVAFYASSFDSITLVACQYSYKEVMDGEDSAPVSMKLFWAIALIMLPIALIFSEGSMSNMQSVSIIAAFPIAMVIVLIIASFVKDARAYIKELQIGEHRGEKSRE